MKQRWIVGSVAAALALGTTLQWLNWRQVHATLCDPGAATCNAGRHWLAFEGKLALPVPAKDGEAMTSALGLRADAALLRRNCAGAWSLAFGARVDLDPLVIGDAFKATGGCADLGRSASSARLLEAQFRQGACVVDLSPATLAWHEALELHLKARIPAHAAQACVAALGDRGRSALAEGLTDLQASFDARYALPHGATAAPAPTGAEPGGLRHWLATIASSHQLVLSSRAGTFNLSLASRPGAGSPPSSPELRLGIGVDGPLLKLLPPELQPLLTESKRLDLRWNLDHETGQAFVQEQPVRKLSDPPRPAGPVDLAGECRAEASVPLHFVEAGENGEARDPRQLQAVLAAVEAAQARGGAMVSVFVHGWQHSAAPGDSYVCDFSSLIRAVAMMERNAASVAHRPERAIIGVYLGWPGRIYPTELANLTTFWNRLLTADRIGSESGVLRALLYSLSQAIARGPRDPRPDYRSGLVVTGHSMGGRAVFHAVKDAAALGTGPAPADKAVPDLVLMVNPAFSAEQYRAVHERARQCQPVRMPMRLFSSETDAVTRQVYPAGQAATFDSAHRRGVPFPEHAYTAANLDEFVTHRLGFELLDGKLPSPTGAQSILRGIERVPAGSRELLVDNPVVVYHQPSSGRPARSAQWYRLRLEPKGTAAPACASEGSRVVTVDARVLPDHGTIFTPAFMEYVIRTFNRAGSAQPGEVQLLR